MRLRICVHLIPEDRTDDIKGGSSTVRIVASETESIGPSSFELLGLIQLPTIVSPGPVKLVSYERKASELDSTD